MPISVLILIASLLMASPSLLGLQRTTQTPAVTHQNRRSGTLILSGRVVMEGGQPLTEMVQVDLVCNGRISQVAPTAQDGSFTFDVGSARTDDWLDPSIGGSASGTIEGKVEVIEGGKIVLDKVPSMGPGRFNFSGCEVRLSPEAGFVSDSIPLTTRSTSDNPDIGTIVVRRLSNNGSTTVSVSVLSAPRQARKAFENATGELAKAEPNTGKIKKELHKAIEKHPEFSAAWDLLGRVHMSEGNSAEARRSFLRAIEVEPGFIRPYLGLAQMGLQESAWDETAKWTESVLELDADYPQALYWNGLAHYYLSEFEKGEKALSRLYQLGHGEEYPFGLLPLGVIHANQGNIQVAAKELRLYLRTMPAEGVPDNQRLELERQLALWESQGLTSSSDEMAPDSASSVDSREP